MTGYRQNVGENLLLALDTIRGHKFRSFLTILGVLIGTTTVIAVASIFAGLDKEMADAARDFGTRSMWIFKFQPGIHIGPAHPRGAIARTLRAHTGEIFRLGRGSPVR